MPFDWLARNLLVSLFLPPANVLVLAGLGFICWRRFPRVGKTLSIVAALALWLQATPWFSNRLAHSLDIGPALDIKTVEAQQQAQASTPPAPSNSSGNASALPQAVVILGGGISLGATEYGRHGGADLPQGALARVRYGAFLARHAQLPVLVSGGAPSGYPVSEGQLMANVLQGEFGVPVRWIEGQSLNTAQNAIFSARMLTNVGVTRVYLVTNAWHMRRARDQFVRAGLTVVPAPCCDANALEPDAAFGWWPTLDSLRTTRVSLREWMALSLGH
ncbi:YdcF family protein [Pandoraea anapnoica]|uniref:YdcF family protein n=1 Tax=Pandoraea anapnoica TaxID=2508301 RepID=A0A5E5AHC8_9BURK|nr:YdcF family protein [Pandoraea anapnoica]VVE71470.1 YdcF family protein [Pandoraea anapnoica]